MQVPNQNQVKERMIFLAPQVKARTDREHTTKDYEALNPLGKGAYGTVFSVRHKQTKQIYALKQITKKQIKNQKMEHQIQNEVRIMYLIDHPNIIRLYTHFEEEEFIYLVIEFAGGGQLWHKLNQQGRFDEQTVKRYMRDIISAVEYLQSMKPPIIHRDIKPENLLLDRKGNVKLADFGWSNVFNDSKRKTYCGTLDYLAPEMIQEIGHDIHLDIWSLGVLIFELLVGRAPFAPPDTIKDQKEQQKILEYNILNLKIEFPKDFPIKAKDLVGRMLKKDPNQRISIQQVREHPWFLDDNYQNILKPLKVDQSTLQLIKPENIPDQDGIFTKEQVANIINRNTRADKQQQLEQQAINHIDAGNLQGSNVDGHQSQLNGNMNMNLNSSNIMSNSNIMNNSSNNIQQQNHELDDHNNQMISNLNTRIAELNKELNSVKVQLQVTQDELTKLQQEHKCLKEQGPSDMVPAESRRYKLLEEERNKLKQDQEDLWEQLKEKETIIQRQKIDLQKLEELKRDAEKHKADKSSFHDKYKKLQDEMELKEQEYQDALAQKQEEINSLNLKQKEKHFSLSRTQSDSGRPSEMGNGQGLKELYNQIDELKQKFDQTKEQYELLEQTQTKYKELEKELIRLRNEKDNEINEAKIKLQETMEDEIDRLKREDKEKMQKMQEEYDQKIRELQNQIDQLSKDNINKFNRDLEYESLKKQLDYANETIKDQKSMCDFNKKLRNNHEQQIKDQEMLLKDQEETIKKFNKIAKK